MYKNITPDYYGYRDEDDGVLVTREAVREVLLLCCSVLCCAVPSVLVIENLVDFHFPLYVRTVFSVLCEHALFSLLYVRTLLLMYVRTVFFLLYAPTLILHLPSAPYTLQKVLIARVVDEFKEKIKKLREDVERTGGVFGGAELALLEGNGENRAHQSRSWTLLPL